MDEDADAVLAVDFEHFLNRHWQNFSPFVVKIRIRLFGLDDSDLQKDPGSPGGFMELGWSDRGLQWGVTCSSGRNSDRMGRLWSSVESHRSLMGRQ